MLFERMGILFFYGQEKKRVVKSHDHEIFQSSSLMTTIISHKYTNRLGVRLFFSFSVDITKDMKHLSITCANRIVSFSEIKFVFFRSLVIWLYVIVSWLMKWACGSISVQRKLAFHIQTPTHSRPFNLFFFEFRICVENSFWYAKTNPISRNNFAWNFN